VIEGAVQVYRSSAEGREQVLITQGPGQGVAEVPLFDGGPYPASGRMVEGGSLLFLAADDFHRLYREHPEIAEATIRELGRRLRRLVMLVEKISLREVHARVAAALLEYAEQAGNREAAFRLPRTQEQMASELATTRESVSRAMARLSRERVIEKRGSRVRILDPRQLESIAISGGSGS
jgi:CRP-like cAMP-binding protein